MITNAGGINPTAAAGAAKETAKALGLSGLKIATVLGDDLMNRLGPLPGETSSGLANMETGEPYSALPDAPLFARHEKANPNCPVGRAVGPLLDRVLGQAEGSMLQSLKRTTLADLLRSQEVVTQLAG